MNDRRRHERRRSRLRHGGDPAIPRASRADVLALIEQFRHPGNRVDDFEGVAQALVHEGRRYGLEIPA